jgi:hypothetical protein
VNFPARQANPTPAPTPGASPIQPAWARNHSPRRHRARAGARARSGPPAAPRWVDTDGKAFWRSGIVGTVDRCDPIQGVE